MTNKAIDGGFLGRAPARVACQTAAVIRFIGRDTKVVERIAGLAVCSFFLRWISQPCPVNGLVKLLFGLGVTGNTCSGYLFTGFEIILQDFVLGMIRCLPVFFVFGGLLGHRPARCLLLLRLRRKCHLWYQHQPAG